jgi:RNA polymerase sigma-70 factor (ECF subfamily)
MPAVRRASREDPAFDNFFTAHLPQVYRVAARILGPTPAAEDVAVEAMARAFSHWSSVRSMAHPRAWVVRVATNLALDEARRRRPTPQPPPSAEPASTEVVLRRSLVTSLKRLPRRQREVVVLRYIADMSEQEVAAALGLSVGTVKTHLHRALPRMRAELGTPA